MPVVSIFNFKGINTFTNPMSLPDGQVIQAVNVMQTPFGAYTKRPGYGFYQSTPDGSAVTSLFAWYRADGQSFNVYRASGNTLYYSTQGTGAWTAMGNGGISQGAHFGMTVLNDVMVGGDGVNLSRYSTDGTSLVNIANAPISQFWTTYAQRAYGLGTGVAFAYSSANDATNWTTGGTSDSATYDIGGEGSVSYLFKNSDRVFFVLSGRHEMYQWDGFNLVDMVNDLGPTSPYSFDQTENVAFWMNRLGVFSFSGSSPQIISNPIQRLVTNPFSSGGIRGVNFGTIPGATHLYDYFAAVGTVTDSFSGGTVSNAILKYDIRQNAWSTWTFANPPTAFLSFVDAGLDRRLIFGDAHGQCYVFDSTSRTDQGVPIQSILEFLVHCGTIKEKFFYTLRMSMNPGCEAQIEVAVSNSLSPRTKKWVSAGQAIDGVVEFRLPSSMSRGRFMFVKISDNTETDGFELYAAEVVMEAAPTDHDG